MEIKALINKRKKINSAIIDFIDATDDFNSEYRALIEILDKYDFLNNIEEIQLLFQIISKIADNHHKASDFFDKIEKFSRYLIEDIPSPISFYIPNYINYNTRILFLLLEKGFLKPDETFLKHYLGNQNTFSNKNLYKYQTFYYLYPSMKEFIDEKLQKQIEEEIINKCEKDISIFYKKCQIGENDSYICSLIRSDSIEEFVSYVNRNNISFSAQIKPSIYETNLFLIDKEPTLIEYASFFGSIQIIQYLKNNKVPLTFSMWSYVVHSNDAELVCLLEENKIYPDKFRKESFENVLIESIKCHHNSIFNYINNNLYWRNKDFYDYIVNSFNFVLYPDEIDYIICYPRDKKGFNLSLLCFSLTTITIPSSVTSIGDFAFNECSLLKKIIISSSVTSIGYCSFSECSSLAQVLFESPSSLTIIGKHAFYKCSNLAEIEIPFSVTKIGDYVFSVCSSLNKITIPSSITSIGNHLFNNCSSLTQIIIPSSVISIGNKSFYRCSKLEQIFFEIPSSVTKIGDSAFSECSSLMQIIIPSSVTSIENNAFYGCSSLAQITIPSSVTSFGHEIFKGILQLTINGDIKQIPNNLFSRCSSLTKIVILSSVKSIGDYAFYECSSLKQIEIPSSLTKIGNYAFYKCSSLGKITIPSSLVKIGNHAFSECPLLSYELMELIKSIQAEDFEESSDSSYE